jgi:quinol monooxygenase YgiN
MPETLTFTTEVVIKPEKVAEYLEALNAVLPHARREPSCMFLYVNQSTTELIKFLLFERWRDRVEFQNDYLNRDHFKRYLASSEALYAAPRVVTIWSPFEPIEPGT